jgi:hypothetical protein
MTDPTITNGYATLAEYKQRFGTQGTDANRDIDISKVIEDISRLIDTKTHTQFYASTAATARYFPVQYPCKCFIDDIETVVSIAVDSDFSGTWGYTLGATDYLLQPLNSKPWTAIEITPWSSSVTAFPVGHPQGVKISGTWGNTETWALDLVREACLLQTARIYRRREAIFGVTAPNEFGQQTIIDKLDADVMEMLRPVDRSVIV